MCVIFEPNADLPGPTPRDMIRPPVVPLTAALIATPVAPGPGRESHDQPGLRPSPPHFDLVTPYSESGDLRLYHIDLTRPAKQKCPWCGYDRGLFA